MTISAWINPVNWTNTDGSNANRRILQKGAADNQFRLLAEGGRLVFHLANVGRLEGPLPSAGTWHHVAAAYDGTKMSMIVDGVELASRAVTGKVNSTTDLLYLGAKHKNVTVTGDYFLGKMDDLRIYNYALSVSEIRDLLRLGENAPPFVNIADPGNLVLSVSDYIALDATAVDLNNDPVTMKWTAVGPAAVTFDPADNVEDPHAVFTQVGTYTLRLTVNDGKAGLDNKIFAEVTTTVSNPTCTDVVAIPGMVLLGDFNKDCHVTLADLAEFAANWLKCNDPMDPTCPNPFKTPLP